MPNVDGLIRAHAPLEVGPADRIYLNALVPCLQIKGGVVGLLLHARSQQIPSLALFASEVRISSMCRLQAKRTSIPWCHRAELIVT